jgi:hypothetical protein
METRIGPVHSGQSLAVQTSAPAEINASALLDGVAVSALSYGQVEVAGLAELIGKITDIVEWTTPIGPEAAYTGAENGPDNWQLATTDNSEKYGGGNLPPANAPGSVAGLTNGWEYCDMNIVEYAHNRTDSYYCDGYNSHGFDGNDKHLMVSTQLDGGAGAVYDEPVRCPPLYVPKAK